MADAGVKVEPADAMALQPMQTIADGALATLTLPRLYVKPKFARMALQENFKNLYTGVRTVCHALYPSECLLQPG